MRICLIHLIRNHNIKKIKSLNYLLIKYKYLREKYIFQKKNI